MLGSQVTALTVAEPLHFLPVTPAATATLRVDYEVHVKEDGARILGAVTEKANAAGVAIETLQMTAGDAWRGIIDTAEQKGCDLIVMASHGRRGVSAFLMGSVTTKVLSHSKVPVLVYRA